jgi:Putative addiction module component
MSYAQLVDEALRLSRHEQLHLARTLLEHAEAEGDLGAEAVWEEEIERRIRLVDAGLAQGRPFADALRDLDKRLGK